MIPWLLACAAEPRLPDPAVGLLHELDRDGSGRVEKAEAPWMASRRAFTDVDADHDEALDVTELASFMVNATILDLTGGADGPMGGRPPPGQGKPPPGGPRPPGPTKGK